MKVNMLTGVNMETKGEFRECALNRSKSACAQLPTNMLFNFTVLGFKRRKQEATTIYRIVQEAVNKAIEFLE